MKGLIFSVKRYSIHDGQGIRVTFFMKGCPLRCRWCHNPEGISPIPESVVKTNRIGTHEFSHVEEAGKYFTIDSVMEILDKEQVFMNHSNGGVTFSGGEPMMQTEFLLEVLRTCKEKGYHTAVDTSGYSSAQNLKSIIPYTDLFLFDIKHLDESRHIELTGASNKDIINNYLLLTKCEKDMYVRIPIIPDMNDDDDYLKRLRDFLILTKTDSVKRINLLPYHKIGSSKYKKFNIPYRMEGVEPPDNMKMQKLKRFFMETGIPVKIGG
jgi:pyruvate formate lyase activating enzyme